MYKRVRFAGVLRIRVLENPITVLLPYREHKLTPKMPKYSLYGRSARVGIKDFLKSRKIRSYYIKGPKTPICTILMVFFNLFVASNQGSAKVRY